jgi:hypothetical protein
VKRGTLLLTILAGLAVFLVVLVLYLPASWIAGLLPAQVRCSELGGSVWHGECLGLQWQGTALGDATWNVAPGRALTGKLSGDLELRGTAVNLRTEFDTNFSGVGELRNLSGRVVLDPALLPQFPPQQRGSATAQFARLQLAEGLTPGELEGTLQLHDLRQVGSQPLELGSYQLTFDAGSTKNGVAVGTLRDLAGPFAVDGTVTLTPPNAYLVQGFITGRTALAERIVREITLGAMPDPAGRSTFSFEGSY